MRLLPRNLETISKNGKPRVAILNIDEVIQL